MTALVDYQIQEAIESGHMEVEPFDPALINPSSLDIILGNQFARIRASGKFQICVPDSHGGPAMPTGHGFKIVDAVDVTHPDSFTYDRWTSETFVVEPHGFCLGVALERFKLPDDISFRIIGKSSWARVGIDNSSAGGWAECGFPGSLVLEFHNLTDSYQVLRSGSKCGQLVFERHEPARTAYDKHEKSRYKNQVGLQGSKGV